MVDQLTQDYIAARKAGMTYGKWKALHYVPPVEVEIPKKGEMKPEVRDDLPKRACRYCGKEFNAACSQKLYCNHDCYYEAGKIRSKAYYLRKKERMMASGKV